MGLKADDRSTLLFHGPKSLLKKLFVLEGLDDDDDGADDERRLIATHQKKQPIRIVDVQ